MNPYWLLAILFWFLTGLVFALFFFEPARNWLKSFNTRYAERYARYFRREDGKPRDALQMKRRLIWFEIGAVIIGTLLFKNPLFGFWAFGFTLFGIYYLGKLLHKRELDKFDEQMVDITYAMKNALKAGMTLQQAMALVATEFQPPASEQFQIALREVQLGASIDDSLKHLEERVPNADLKIIVNAVEILRQTGGNMIETFENVTETLKNRKRVEGKIKSITAQGRMGAIILCAMPFVMALLLYFLSREYISPLFTTLLGNIILTIVLLLVSTGWIMIQKIISIEV
jgi:tight adherence protein B